MGEKKCKLISQIFQEKKNKDRFRRNLVSAIVIVFVVLPYYRICVEFSLMQQVDMPRPRQQRSLFSSETVYLKFVDDATAIVVADADAVAVVFDDQKCLMYFQRYAVIAMRDLLTDVTNVVMPAIDVWVIATDQIVVAHKVQVYNNKKTKLKKKLPKIRF